MGYRIINTMPICHVKLNKVSINSRQFTVDFIGVTDLAVEIVWIIGILRRINMIVMLSMYRAFM